MSKRIKGTIPTSNSSIKKTELSPPLGLSFSYKYFQADHNEFTISDRDALYLASLLGRLRDLSKVTASELRNNNSKTLRCHSIDWTSTSQSCFGISNEDQLVDKPYQFSLSSNEHGRVHGFFIKEVFYIVWLDPRHKLYPKP